MRWDELFADLDRRFEEMANAAEDAEQADRARLAFGQVAMVERLRGASGGQLRVRLSGGRLVVGRLTTTGPDWLLLAETEGVEVLVALAAVTAVEGLSQRTGAVLSTVDARFDFRKALRSVARDRAPVTVHTMDGTEMSGTIDRVGLDFVELAAHAAWEVRRPDAVRGVVLLPLTGIVMVRAAPLG